MSNNDRKKSVEKMGKVKEITQNIHGFLYIFLSLHLLFFLFLQLLLTFCSVVRCDDGIEMRMLFVASG